MGVTRVEKYARGAFDHRGVEGRCGASHHWASEDNFLIFHARLHKSGQHGAQGNAEVLALVAVVESEHSVKDGLVVIDGAIDGIGCGVGGFFLPYLYQVS